MAERMGQDELDSALATGRHREELQEYFGPDLYAELSVLAGEAQRRRVRGGQPVGILPGIMGSSLSIHRNRQWEVVWLNFMTVIFGGARLLHLRDGDSTVQARGLLERYYAKLRLALMAKGYDVIYIPFDWRLSLDALGRDLLSRIDGIGHTGRIHLVCHSMGGLVARAAAKINRQAFDKVIQLGTPNFGSFSPVTAIRGVHPIARKIEVIDITQGMDAYIDLFASFPGLLQMIPNPDRYPDGNLFDLKNWPAGTRVTGQALAQARRVSRNALAGGDERFTLIAGIDQDTIVGTRLVKQNGRETFHFLRSRDGDGTVPLALARLDGIPTYYVAEEHGALPNNSQVARAVDELLRGNTTNVLPRAAPVRRDLRETEVSESDLGEEAAAEALRGRRLSAREERHLLDGFLSTTGSERAAVEASADRPTVLETAARERARSQGIVVGRRRQRRVDLQLAHGSITEADARALVLGVYENVTPGGAAAAVDAALGGTIRRYIERRMFNGALGETTVIPARRRRLRTEFVIFSGLGAFDQLSPALLHTVGENLARVLVETQVEDVAIVPFAGGSGFAMEVILRNFLQGFFHGLSDVDTDRCFRRITVCETDRRKYDELADEILRLATTELFDGVEATIDLIQLPEAPSAAAVTRDLGQRGPQPLYLIARRYASQTGLPQDGGDMMEFSVLTGGATAAIVSEVRQIDPDRLEQRLKIIDEGEFNEQQLQEFGTILRTEILGSRIAEALTIDPGRPLVLVHDAGASRLPWETLQLEGFTPALQGGMSRRYMSRDLSVAKWLEARVVDEELDVLLIVNPTGDLGGAEDEGQRVREVVAGIDNARLTTLWRAEATRARVLELLESGQFDVVHYAGHAFFDPQARHRSGIVCAGKEVVSGLDLAGLSSLPALAVFNACQSARTRALRGDTGGGRQDLEPLLDSFMPDSRREAITRNVSLAEAFLRGGIANFVGTHWPVGDAPAVNFAQTFYESVAAHAPINAAITAARNAVLTEAGSSDWADYIHYGDPYFVVKAGAARAYSRPMASPPS